MIYDRVAHLSNYRGLDRHLATAIDYALATDLRTLPLGRVEVDGDDVYAAVHAYETKQPAAAKYEAHRQYVDLQIMVEGVERMDIVDVSTLEVMTPYDAATDAAFYRPAANALRLAVSAGEFAIFLPHDAHAPTIAVGNPTQVRKVVLKVRAW